MKMGEKHEWDGEERDVYEPPAWIVMLGIVVISFLIVFAEALANLVLGGI